MRATLLLICLLSGSSLLCAQNLVPNPSFEELPICPAFAWGRIYQYPYAGDVSNWYAPNLGTTDYYSTCNGGVPGGPGGFFYNWAGYQQPRTGEAYIGMVMDISYGDFYREYAQVKLAGTLVAGHQYFCNYWICLTDHTYTGHFGLDRMGAYFSNGPLSFGLADLTLPFTPYFTSPPGYIYTDTANWREVSGTFTATGTESWIIIGNYVPKDSMNRDTTSIGISLPYAYDSYYAVDDVCLLDIDGAPTVFSSRDTLLCTKSEIMIAAKEGFRHFVWDNGSTDSIRAISAPGTYWVKAIDPFTCTIAVDTIHVTGSKEIDLGADTTICGNEPLLLSALTPGIGNYVWSTGATTASIWVSTPGSYYVHGYLEDCLIAADTISIDVFPEPAPALPPDTVLCEGMELELNAMTGNMHNVWNTGDTSCCISVRQNGRYTVTATNSCGQSRSDEVNVAFMNCDYCIMVPSAFSPNNDGINDLFAPVSRCVLKYYSLQIFNRWGQLVFSSTDIDKAWDGTANGHPADQGTYFYQLETIPIMSKDEKISRKGDIALIR